VNAEHINRMSGLNGTLTKILADASTRSLAGFLRMHLINSSVFSNSFFLQSSSLPSLKARSRAVVALTWAQGDSTVPDWDIAR